MKKAAVLCMTAVMMFSTGVFAAETESEEAFFPSFEQTASAYLDQDGNEVAVTVDLTGGWSVEFVRGAVYLYDGKIEDGEEPVAAGYTLEKAVFEDYADEAKSSGSYREFARSFAFTEESGANDYFFSVGPDAYFMITVDADADGDAVSSRFGVEAAGYEGDPAYEDVSRR